MDGHEACSTDIHREVCKRADPAPYPVDTYILEFTPAELDAIDAALSCYTDGLPETDEMFESAWSAYNKVRTD